MKVVSYSAQAAQLQQAIAKLSPELQTKLKAEIQKQGGSPELDAAETLAEKLPELAQAVSSGVESRVEQLLKSLGGTNTFSEGVTRALGYETIQASKLFQDPKLKDALAALGLESLTPEAIANNFAASLSAMARAVADAAGESDAPFKISATSTPSERAAAFNQSLADSYGKPPASGTHVLVTMDAGSALEPRTIPSLFESGMTLARINNAHDDEATRTNIALRFKSVALERTLGTMPADAKAKLQAAVGAGKELVSTLANDTSLMRKLEGEGLLPAQPRLLSDLGGPKNRTGPSLATKGTIKVRVPRSEEGFKLSRSSKLDKAAKSQLGRFVFSLADGVDAQGATRLPFAADPKELHALTTALKHGTVLLKGHDVGGTRKREIILDGVIEKDGKVTGLKGRALDSTFFAEGQTWTWEKQDGKAEPAKTRTWRSPTATRWC
jgi:hypothetical protein